jgi:hypothetical protein
MAGCKSSISGEDFYGAYDAQVTAGPSAFPPPPRGTCSPQCSSRCVACTPRRQPAIKG